MKTNPLKIQLFLDKRDNGIAQPDGTVGTQNYTDYWINVNLTREYSVIDEYIDIQTDPFRTKLEKQNVNPWFIEFGFFESIQTTGITGKTNDYKVLPELLDVNKKAKIFSIDINR